MDEAAELATQVDAGMIPKLEACVAAVRGGVPQAHMIDGRVAHSLLLEVFTSEGVGTMITAGDPGDPGDPDGTDGADHPTEETV